MRDKHINARFDELNADLGRVRETLKTHARQDAVDAAHAVASSAEDQVAALRAELDGVKAEFAGLRESVRQAAGLAAEPAGPAGDPEPVTPITKAPRSRRASSS